MSKISIETIDTLNGFHALKPHWDRLLSQCSFGTIFSSHDWLSVWWEILGEGHSPFVLVARRDSEVVGIAPLMQTDNRLEFMGTPNVDYADFLIAPPVKPVLEAFIAHLATLRSRFVRIELDQISDRSATLQCLRDIMPTSGLPYHLRPLEPTYSYVYDGPPEQQSEFTLKLKNSSRVNRYQRRLERNGGHRYRRVMHEDILNDLPLLFHLHYHRWKGTPTPSKFADRTMCEFYTRLTERLPTNSTFLSLLQGPKATAAGCFGFMSGDTAYLYTIGNSNFHHKLSPGTVLLLRQTEDFIRTGTTTIDYIRGGEGYKSRFTNTENHNFCLTVFDSPSAAKKHLRWERFKESSLGLKLRNNSAIMALRIGADQYTRRHGKTGLVRFVAGKIGRYIWDAPGYDLYQYVADRDTVVEIPRDIRFSELSADDLETLAILHGWWDGSEEFEQARNRFAEGGRCFGAFSGEMLIAATWLVTRPEQPNRPRLKVTLTDDELLAAGSYTSPIFRKRGIQTALKLWAYTDQIPRTTRIVALVPRANKAISAVWRKLGTTRTEFRRVYSVLGQPID